MSRQLRSVWWDGGVPDAAVTQATFCATLVDEWVRGGVRHAVISPGSRSTPLALALAADDRVAVHVHHDERCTAFIGLGIGLATGRPAVALCTSGTAATHFHAAVVEAHHARVPLLVCTADRPPELRDVGAPQTIDQSHLYGGAVRWFFDPGPPDEAMRASWRSIAARSVVDAADGPVHLNLPFREPLVAVAGELPAPADGPWPAWRSEQRPIAAALDHELARALPGRRGVIVAGRGAGSIGAIERVAVRLGWPVLADPLSGYDGRNVVRHADPLLRVGVPEAPEVVLRLGAPPASKVLGAWMASGALVVHVGHGADPARVARASIAGDAWAVAEALDGLGDEADAPPVGWVDGWIDRDVAADSAIGEALAADGACTEPGTARDLLAALPAGSHLVVSSSMPIRDLEWFALPRRDVTVHSNRGVNGIDGVVSTAVGVALASGAPTACLLGDVAFLHDSNALLGLVARGVDLAIVVIDNDGGGIFSFLPQATALAADRFEQLFGTPHGVRPEALAAVHGIAATVVDRAADLPAALGGAGVRLVVVRTDRAANVALHDRLGEAVAAAVART